jgi:CRISPR-associated protein Cmr5
MRNNLETQQINEAIKAIIGSQIAKNGIVPKQFTGYISSFGASVIQSGLIPAVIFFEDENANSEEPRHLLIRAIEKFLSIEPKLSKKLLEMDDEQLFDIEEEIIVAAQAIKLALRTFKKSDK